MVNASDIKDEQDLFNQTWFFFKKFYDIDFNNDDGWIALVEESNKICEQFKGTDCEHFARHVVVAATIRIEGAAKKRMLEDLN